MARRIVKRAHRRNTAPMWKKAAVVLSAPLAVGLIASYFHASTWSLVPFAAMVVGVAAAAVWLVARLLGVHLSLRSWD
ncbi:MAG: hypothetical protein WC709_02855 [Thermoleophilia bacterium]